MRRALLGVAALSGLLLVSACGSDDDDVDTSIPSVDSVLDPVDSVLDTIAPEDSAGPVDSSVTGDTMSPVVTTPMDSTMTSSSTMTSDTASSATVAP